MTILNSVYQKGVVLYSTKEGYVFQNDINSKVLGFAFGLMAEIERNLISMRTKEALARRKQEGKHLGRKKGDTPKMKILAENKEQASREHKKEHPVLNSPGGWECPEQPCSVFCIVHDRPQFS